MDLVSIIADLASPDLTLSEVAARHGLTIEALSIYLASDQAQATLDLVQSTLAIRTRLAAQLHLPLAIAAIGTLLTSHRAVACPSPSAHGGPLSPNAQQGSPPDAHARQDSPLGDKARHDEVSFHLSAAHQPNPPTSEPRTRTSRNEARTLRHQVELRRAAATLLRFANFNHRARSRTDEPRHANTVSETPRTTALTDPALSAFSPPEPPRTSTLPVVPPSRAQHVEAHASPAATTPISPIATTPAPALAAIDAPATAFASSAATTVFPDAASAAITAPVSSSTPITASSPAAACTLSSPSPSNQSPSTSSVPFPFPTPPCSSHLEPSSNSSSSSPLFLRGSVPPWLVPSSTSPRRPRAANRLAAAAGAPTHPP
jgi:hypothetical protein